MWFFLLITCYFLLITILKSQEAVFGECNVGLNDNRIINFNNEVYNHVNDIISPCSSYYYIKHSLLIPFDIIQSSQNIKLNLYNDHHDILSQLSLGNNNDIKYNDYVTWDTDKKYLINHNINNDYHIQLFVDDQLISEIIIGKETIKISILSSSIYNNKIQHNGLCFHPNNNQWCINDHRRLKHYIPSDDSMIRRLAEPTPNNCCHALTNGNELRCNQLDSPSLCEDNSINKCQWIAADCIYSTHEPTLEPQGCSCTSLPGTRKGSYCSQINGKGLCVYSMCAWVCD